MTAAQRGSGVACPACGAGLDALLDTHVAVRLTRQKDGRYGLGGVSTPSSILRRHLLKQHGDGQRLELDEEGIVVSCGKCDFIGTLTSDGVETEADRQAEHHERTERLREEGAEL